MKLESNEYNINPYALKKEIIGKWKIKYIELDTSSKTNGQKAYTYDLSSYLPDDKNIYDVLIGASAWTRPNSGTNDNLIIGCFTDIFTRDNIAAHLPLIRIGGATISDQAASVIVPIGPERTLGVSMTVQNSSENRTNIYLFGYRKVK